MEAPTKHFKKRDAILACLRQTRTHPSAESLHQMLHEEHPDISLATVYRNLSLFKSQGLIVSLGTVGAMERFDANVEPHVHFICTSCGSVRDLMELEVPESLSASAESTAGGRVDSFRLTFSGLCENCLASNKLS